MQQELRKATRVMMAYLLASLGSIVLAWVTGLIWQEWARVSVNYKLWISVVWITIVGVSSALAMVEYLMKQLGARRRPSAMLRIANERIIPIKPNLGAEFHHILKLQPQLAGAAIPGTLTPAVTLGEIELQVGDYLLSEQLMTNFLRTAWSRQRRKQAPFSRTWWVGGGHLDRIEYETVMQALEEFGLTTGRTQGRSGKLLYPPPRAITILRGALPV